MKAVVEVVVGAPVEVAAMSTVEAAAEVNMVAAAEVFWATRSRGAPAGSADVVVAAGVPERLLMWTIPWGAGGPMVEAAEQLADCYCRPRTII